MSQNGILSKKTASAPSFAGAWNPSLYQALLSLIREFGAPGPSHDATRPPVAVFDFDDTVIFRDFGERAFRRQVDTLLFGFTPDELADHLPDRPEGVEFLAPSYGGARISDISKDVASAYEKLYTHIRRPAGKRSLEEARRLDHFHDFRVKLNLLFDGLNETEGVGKAFAYPWSVQLLAGLRPDQVAHLAMETWRCETTRPLGREALRSPEALPTRSGVQTINMTMGIRRVPEMSRLIETLQARGFQVHLVTASHEVLVRSIVSETAFGYRLPPENVLGMRLCLRDGRYLPILDDRNGYAATYGPGKVRVIDSQIRRPPVLVAGDSDTDYHMLSAYPETRVRILVDRKGSGVMEELYEKCDAAEDGFFLQRRNKATGAFLPIGP